VELERLNPQQFERFREFIYSKSGIRIDQQKVTLLSNRIRRRLKTGNFEDFDAYYQHLTSQAGADELEGFLDAITTNETFFFRTAKHFDWFRNCFIPDVVAQQRAAARTASLRVWSAGCASGAEPYSIAICLAENMFRLRKWTLQVVGTDISQEMLQAAREGVFKPQAIESVTEQQRRRYFQRQPGSELWKVRPEIKRLVSFQLHNLMQPLPAEQFDCVFLCNVLIYFDRDSKQIVIQNIRRSLALGGFLVVGPSEGVYDMLAPLKRTSPLIYQKVDELP
jgi:chemotaxis protein methyltransferase CheR